MTQLDIESKALDQENQRSGFDEKARAREEKRNANEAFVEKRISASTGHNPRKSSSSRDSISSGKRRSSTEGTRVEKVDRDIFRPENHGRDGQQPIEEPVGAFSVREREYSNSIRNNEAHVEPSENLAIASVVVPDENIADKKVNDTEKMNSIENKQLSPKSMAIFAIVALVVIVIGVVAAVVLTGEEENGGNAASVSSKRKTALLIVDVQDCFIGSASVTANGQVGSLPVAGSEEIIPIINRIRDEKSCLFDLVVRTQDFHPTKHISFASTFGLEPYVHITGGKGELELKCVNIGEGSCCPEAFLDDRYDCERNLCPNRAKMELDGTLNHVLQSRACQVCTDLRSSSCFPSSQAMWTDHCEQTGDSGFPQDLVVDEENDVVFEKGTNDYTDGYSPFFDNTGRISTGLGEILQDNGIEDIVLVGIAFDYAIRYAANHAKNLGYDVSVIADASAVIDQQVALDTTTEMIANKVSILSSDDIIKMEC